MPRLPVVHRSTPTAAYGLRPVSESPLLSSLSSQKNPPPGLGHQDLMRPCSRFRCFFRSRLPNAAVLPRVSPFATLSQRRAMSINCDGTYCDSSPWNSLVRLVALCANHRESSGAATPAASWGSNLSCLSFHDCRNYGLPSIRCFTLRRQHWERLIVDWPLIPCAWLSCRALRSTSSIKLHCDDPVVQTAAAEP
jgi:hypothetical protein